MTRDVTFTRPRASMRAVTYELCRCARQVPAAILDSSNGWIGLRKRFGCAKIQDIVQSSTGMTESQNVND